jgi:prolyl 4-hydroxylase
MSYKEPQIIRNFLTHEECDNLINFEKDKLKQSRVGKDARTDLSYRNSLHKCHAMDSNKYVASTMAKCSNIINIPLNYFEFIHIVKYDVGGFFRPHLDSVKGTNRVATFLLYLNDDYEGGETRFPNLGKCYRLNKGDALFFHNYNKDLSETSLATHEGCVVTKGEKWIANVWVHKSPIPRSKPPHHVR